MRRLLLVFFMLPWWAYLPASIGVLWLGERVHEQALATELDRAAALEAPVPAAVDLGAFSIARDIHAGGEVHVTGWIDPDLNYELVKHRNGIATETRYLYMMFGATDLPDAAEVRGALMLDAKQRDTFIERIDDFIVGFTDAGDYVFAFDGFGAPSAVLGGEARAAIAEQGLVTSPDFVFIEPFFEGREAALAPKGAPARTRLIGWAIAAALALIGVVKRVRAVTARRASEEPETDVDDPDALEPLVARRFVLPETVPEDTPLARLARRQEMAARAVTAPGVDIESVPGAPAGAPSRTPSRAQSGAPSEAFAEAAGETLATPRAAAPAASRFPPVPDASPAPEAATGSALGFYVKLALAMLVVGSVSYKPALIDAALPFGAVALFWLGVYLAFQGVRQGARRIAAGPGRSPRRRRAADAGRQTVAAGVGGQRIDLAAPGRATRGESGVA